ncbi:glycosyl hydrolase 53 family protein [Xylanibacter brevis]|uniref:glycosyl hydrolase 53 family protein n=1 Tax=Xylanibacter brevis TaxID=83231 RepID=UPI0009E00D25|nr:glycosyl hydrolase 53 family protein [Xylanibacter brevis]
MNLRKLTLLFFIMASVGLSHAQSFYLCTQGDTRTTSQVTFSNNGSTLNGNIQTNTIDSITMHVPALKYVGGDISLLPKYEEQGAQFKDKNGNAITDLVSFVREQGWNTIRVRLFVDPVKGQAITDDVNKKEVVQDLDFVTALGKRIKDAGMLFMLDFHYSDTYADPSKQWTPQDWQSLNNDQLKTKLYEYTRDCLQQLKDNGAAPDFIQTGNEISYGMLWGVKGTSANRCYSTSDAANWNRFFDLLRQAGKACREVCPQAKIIIHSERVPKVAILTDYLDRMKNAEIDYDIIGLSYYPYFHGALSVLDNTLTTLENKKYGKDIQIVETGYPWQWVVPGTTTDLRSTYPYSNEGQKKYTTDLISLLKNHPQVNGLSWWWAEANAKGATGNLNTDWYNASLFDNETGKALDALYELQNFK